MPMSRWTSRRPPCRSPSSIWKRPPGQAAAGRIGVNFGPGDVVQDETIRITGPVLNLNGTADFDRNGELTVLNLPSVRDGTAQRPVVPACRAAPTATTICCAAIRWTAPRSGAPAPTSSRAARLPRPSRRTTRRQGRFHINAKLDRVAMRDGVAIMPFNLDLAGIGNRPSAR